MKILRPILILSFIFSLVTGGCSAVLQLASLGKTVTVQIIYGSEKQEWLDPLVKTYNQAGNKTPNSHARTPLFPQD